MKNLRLLPMPGKDDKVKTPATAGKLYGNYAKCQVRTTNRTKKMIKMNLTAIVGVPALRGRLFTND